MTSGSSVFLNASQGDYVLILETSGYDWYIGIIISCVGGSRSPDAWTLFQVQNIDTGHVRIVNADRVYGIVKSPIKKILNCS